MKLQSMVSFVLEQKETQAGADLNEADYYYQEWCKLQQIRSLAKFLSQPLNLGMFIPCGEDGQPIKHYVKTESEQIADNLNNCRIFSKEEVAYQQAVDRVLFEGFEIRESGNSPEYTKIITDKTGLMHVAWFSRITQSWKLSKGMTNVESLNYWGVYLTSTAVNQLNK